MSGKGRKQSIASILDEEKEEETSSSRYTAQSRKNRSSRSIYSVINEEPTSTSRLVRCDCIKCNGMMIDFRMKEIHEVRDPGSPLTILTAFSKSESRNQGSQVSVTVALDVLHLQDIPEVDLEE